MARTILEAVVGAVRRSCDPEDSHRHHGHRKRATAVTIARIAETRASQALAVHGRTRACAFEGQRGVRHDCRGSLSRDLDSRCIANGDIDSALPNRRSRSWHHTGAAGVMIGRAAQGQPWICGQIAAPTWRSRRRDPAGSRHASEQGRSCFTCHLRHCTTFYGEYMGVRIARKHVGWYLQKSQATETKLRSESSFQPLETSPASNCNYIRRIF